MWHDLAMQEEPPCLPASSHRRDVLLRRKSLRSLRAVEMTFYWVVLVAREGPGGSVATKPQDSFSNGINHIAIKAAWLVFKAFVVKASFSSACLRRSGAPTATPQSGSATFPR